MPTLNTENLYTRNYEGQLQFGELSESILIDIYKDGRFATEFISRDLEQYFNGLTYVDQAWFDFTDQEFGQVEQKQITTASGFKFCPSFMIGKGRKVDRDLVATYIKDNALHYLVVSTIHFPIIHIRLIPGVRLLEIFPQKNCGSASKDIFELLDMPYATEPK